MDIQIADDPSLPYFFEPEQIKNPIKHGFLRRMRDKLSGKEDIEGAEENTAQVAPPSKKLAMRGVGVGVPRQQTFQRQNSERREKLEPVKPTEGERRAFSTNRRRAFSAIRPRARSSPPLPRQSLPAFDRSSTQEYPFPPPDPPRSPPADTSPPKSLPQDSKTEDAEAPIEPLTEAETEPPGSYDEMIQRELDSKWILNLSMHFRDKSDREKFFVTYAETPTRMRRVTVSCDYRNAEPGSLEMDLKQLPFQRDKNFQIYESIRESLPEIQFYDTVTNLKLETSQGRLHVHVTEDMNEIIQYPPVESVQHLLDDWDSNTDLPTLRTYVESEIEFHSHLSGFVYHVQVDGQDYIKKEIPGPDSVDEFLYEINALHALIGANNVIQLHAIILDDSRSLVKGLLISFAEKGALVDIIFDSKPVGSLPWADRLKWSQQIVSGLSEIHEAGFVQGDFTLSNVVIDRNGDAFIIDINRRGCPVGWEPPEIARKIRSNQRISMYIGVKSDLFQLGMTLWAIAMEDDEPERQIRPLSVDQFPTYVPKWYKDLVRNCLSSMPQQRLSAKELSDLFRISMQGSDDPLTIGRQAGDGSSTLSRRSDPLFNLPMKSNGGDQVSDDKQYVVPSLSSYRMDSGSSFVGISRTSCGHNHYASTEEDGRGRTRSRPDDFEQEDSDFEPRIISVSPGSSNRFNELELDGHPYLISRSTFFPQEIDVLGQEIAEERKGKALIKSDPTDEGTQSVETITEGQLNTGSPQGDTASIQNSNSPSGPSETTPRMATQLPPSSAIPPLNESGATLPGCDSHPALESDSSFHGLAGDHCRQDLCLETGAATEKQALTAG